MQEGYIFSDTIAGNIGVSDERPDMERVRRATRIANIDTTLKNGDIVEVLTSKSAKGPSRDWLTICKSNQARTKIKQWFKKEKREENIVHGRASFESEMKRVGLPLTAATDPELEGQLLKKLSFDTWDDMFAAIGYGGLTAAKAVGRIRDDINKALKLGED